MSSNSVVPLRSGNKVAGIVPTSIEEVFRLATAIAKSGLAPQGMSTAEKLTVAIMHGLEIGIPPMMAVNKIAVVNGRPTLWGDAIPALLLSAGFKLRERFDGDGETRAAVCSVVRTDGETIERRFSVADAKIAGLWGKQGPWKQYPDRMLQMRARGLAARDGAADVLSGLYLKEEVEDEARPMRDITPKPAAISSVPMDEDGIPVMSAKPAPQDDDSSGITDPPTDDEAFSEDQQEAFLAKLREDISICTTHPEREEVMEANEDILGRLSDGNRRRAEAIFEGRGQ